MKFTLRYSGDDLKSAANAGRVREKHILRAHFHEQLKRIWEAPRSVLHRVDRSALLPPIKVQDRWQAQSPDPQHLQTLLFRRTVGGASFVPLVTPHMEVHCNLALRLGRPTRFGTIFDGGDLDGRLKTLFDALAIPKNEDQFPIEERGNEYFCLLSDDDLITGISIDPYQVLTPCASSYVEMDLEITVIPVTPQAGVSTLIFGGW